jgi:hypothetical protein
VAFSDQHGNPFEFLIHQINNCSPKEFLYAFTFSKDGNCKQCLCINSANCFKMRKDDLNDLFKANSIMTKNGDLPKETFLHPESDKDYYKRSSAGDILGKSRKNLSFVVPFDKIDERLKDVFWQKAPINAAQSKVI